MGDKDKITAVLTLLVIFSNYPLTFAQKKANAKCAEYANPPPLFKDRPVKVSIIGGTPSNHDEFPHMVALGYGTKNDIKWLCGGTLISENFVLTAGHCINHKQYGSVKVVRLGVRNLKNKGSIDIDIVKRITHPNYRPPSHYNDIALVQLKNSISFFKSVKPACLNTIFDVKSRTNQLTATGWGLLQFGGSPSNDLMKVNLSLFSYKECKAKYNDVNKRKLSNGIRDSTQICAGGRNNEEKDTCQGDSGGPLVMKVGQLHTVVGITSFGKACGIPNIPSVYTRVSAYVPWIEKIVWP